MRVVSMLFITIILVFAVCTYAVSQEKIPVKPVAPPDVGKAPPDLVVKEIKCGTGNKLQFTVANIGRDSLPSGWMAVADVFFDGRKMGHVDLGRPTSGDITPAGGSATYLVVFDITRPVTVQVVVDATNSIREFSEANNTMTVKLQPCEEVKKPDLIVKIEGPTEARHGEDVGRLLKVTVKNVGRAVAHGTATTPDGYMVDIVLSRDDVLPVRPAVASGTFTEDMLLVGGRISHTEDLAPGASSDYPVGALIPKDTKPGTYCLGAVVDPFNKIMEANEGNNTSCHKIMIR